MIHTVKGFSVVNKAEVDVFLEFSNLPYLIRLGCPHWETKSHQILLLSEFHLLTLVAQSKQKKKENWKEIAVAINEKRLKAIRERKVNRGGFQV